MGSKKAEKDGVCDFFILRWWYFNSLQLLVACGCGFMDLFKENEPFELE